MPLKTNFEEFLEHIGFSTIFVNFMALPSIAAMAGFELPQTNVIISEEECHTSVVMYEKTIPNTLNVHDFIKFFETKNHRKAFISSDDSFRLKPLLSIFSPPPEA